LIIKNGKSKNGEELTIKERVKRGRGAVRVIVGGGSEVRRGRSRGRKRRER
jgi:hypothetical protein